MRKKRTISKCAQRTVLMRVDVVQEIKVLACNAVFLAFKYIHLQKHKFRTLCSGLAFVNLQRYIHVLVVSCKVYDGNFHSTI